MKLHIENLAKIGVADIKLDGITVIVGDNNTGKSTIGKALWAMFDALSNLEQKSYNNRYNNCYHVLTLYPFNLSRFRIKNTPYPEFLARNLVDKKTSIEDAINDIDLKLSGVSVKYGRIPDLKFLMNRLHQILDISDSDLKSQLIMDVFNMVFNGQITSFFHPRKKTFIKMIIKETELSVYFNKALPTIVNKLPLQNNPYFFDDPSQLEQLTPSFIPYTSHETFRSVNHINFIQLKRIAESFIAKSNQNFNAIDTIILRNKFDSISKLFDNTLDGHVLLDKNEGFLYKNKKFQQPLYLNNLSQGIKSLALLQAAFSHGAIQERDVLILDEPEIHLHPDWQIKYAELVVLLQKAFNLTVLLTTHSPDFAQAIRLYSQKHGLAGELNAYISKEQKDGTVTMEEVPQETWDPVFETFTDSFDKLMALRSELRRAKNEQ